MPLQIEEVDDEQLDLCFNTIIGTVMLLRFIDKPFGDHQEIRLVHLGMSKVSVLRKASIFNFLKYKKETGYTRKFAANRRKSKQITLHIQSEMHIRSE